MMESNDSMNLGLFGPSINWGGHSSSCSLLRRTFRDDSDIDPAVRGLAFILLCTINRKDKVDVIVGIWAITHAAGDVMDTSATKILCADSRTFLFFHTDKLLYFLFALFLCYLPSKRPYYIFSTPIDLHLSSLLRIARLR